MPKSSESNSSHEQQPKPPLWLQLLLATTRFVVRGYTSVCEARVRMERESARYLALYSLFANRPVYEYDIDWDTTESAEEDDVISIICAACHCVIGTLDNEEDLEDADAIAIEHSPYCEASEEAKEQAVYDVQFRAMTKEIEL